MTTMTTTTISIDKPTATDLLNRLKPTIGGTLPVLAGVKIAANNNGHLTLTTTSIEHTTELTVHNIDGPEQPYIVPFAAIDKIAKATAKTDHIRLENTTDGVVLANSKVNVTKPALDLDEYPRIDVGAGNMVPDYPVGHYVTALPAIATCDANRPIFNTVCVTPTGDVAATDSYTLIVAATGQALDLDDNVLVPKDAAVLVAKWLPKATDTTVHVADRDITHTLTDGTITHRITSRLQEGDYPQYQTLIPGDMPSSITFTDDDIDKIQTVDKLAGGKNSPAPIRFETDTDDKVTCRIVIQDDGVYSSNLDATRQGDAPTKIAFNPTYLLRLLVESASRELRLIDHLKPGVFVDVDDDGTVTHRLLMPVRV